MKLKHSDHARLRSAIAALAILLAVAGSLAIVSMTVGAAATTDPIGLDDPDNETVEVDVEATNSGDDSVTDADVNVSLETEDGTVADSETLEMSAPENETVAFDELDTLAADDYVVDVSSSDSENVSVEIDESRLIAERTATVEDADNETLAVDAGFNGDENATATVVVDGEDGSELLRDTLSYDYGEYDDNETVITREYNDSDGVEDGNLSVSVETSPASAYDGAWASVGDDSATGGLIGGEIGGQDTKTVVIAVAVIGGAIYYGRQEDWI